MDIKDIVLGLALLMVTAMLGFFLANYGSLNDLEDESLLDQNFTVTSEQEIFEASFSNRTINLMIEDRPQAKFYLDLDTDGSFERQLNYTEEGKVEKSNMLVEVRNRTYRLHLEYRDQSFSQRDDAYLKLYQVDET